MRGFQRERKKKDKLVLIILGQELEMLGALNLSVGLCAS